MRRAHCAYVKIGRNRLHAASEAPEDAEPLGMRSLAAIPGAQGYAVLRKIFSRFSRADLFKIPLREDTR
jgi:hypothetical protein